MRRCTYNFSLWTSYLSAEIYCSLFVLSKQWSVSYCLTRKSYDLSNSQGTLYLFSYSSLALGAVQAGPCLQPPPIFSRILITNRPRLNIDCFDYNVERIYHIPFYIILWVFFALDHWLFADWYLYRSIDNIYECTRYYLCFLECWSVGFGRDIRCVLLCTVFNTFVTLCVAPGASVFLILISIVLFLFIAAWVLLLPIHSLEIEPKTFRALAELLSPSVKTANVTFECGWTAVFSVMQVGAAVAVTVTGPPVFCRPTGTYFGLKNLYAILTASYSSFSSLHVVPITCTRELAVWFHR